VAVTPLPHIAAARHVTHTPWDRYRSAVDGDQQSQLLEFSTDTKEANEMVRVLCVCGCPTCFVCVVAEPVCACASACPQHNRHAAPSPCRATASRATCMQVFYAADLGEQLSAFSGMTLLKQALWLRHALQIVSARHGHQPVILLGWTARARSRHMSTHSQIQSHSKFNHPLILQRHFPVERVIPPQVTPWAACLPPSLLLYPRPTPPLLPPPST
jgi:hypothetical protein